MAKYILPEHIDKIENIYSPCSQFDDLHVVEYPYSFAFGFGLECSTDKVKAIDRLCNFIIKHRNESN